MGNSRRMAWLAVAIFVVAALMGAVAAQAADEAQKIGVVDTDKLQKEAPRVKQYAEELAGFENELMMKLDIRNRNMMLSEEEINELIDSKVKGDKATDQEKSRVKVLEESARSRQEELVTLQNTADLNEQQKARLKELQDVQRKPKEVGNSIAKDYESRYLSKRQELGQKADADVLEAVKKIAEAKGLTMVMVKATLLYGGTDITDEVISKLDRKVN